MFKLITLKKLTHQKYLFLSVIAILALTMVAYTGCSPTLQAAQLPYNSDFTNIASAAATSLYDENTIISLYERAIPSVVKVAVVVEEEAGTSDPFGFGPFQRRGQGSGFIIDDQGHILTNNHVVESASSVKITVYNGDDVDAEVLGSDRENDLALLKTDPSKLGNITPLPLGNSDETKPGQMAIALGTPFGLEGSITVGVISAIGRSIPSEAQRLITNMLQTDAAINPGNSGGPLLNSKGEVIGINTAIDTSSYGIGFAIPINTVKSLLPALLKGGEVSSPWLGVRGIDINHELASELDLSVDRGVYVVEVLSGSPAEKAGLRGSGTDEQGQPTSGGDAIISVDGQAVAKVEDLIAYFNGKYSGDEVSLSIYRGCANLSITVTLGEWPKQIPIS